MDHETLKDRLHAFLDAELAASDRAGLEAHLRECAECGGFAERWRALSAAVLKTPPSPVSEARVRRILERVEAEAAAPAPELETRRWGWAPSALAFAAAAALFVLSSREPLAPVSWESVLLAAAQPESAWEPDALADEPDADAVLAFALEERR